MAKLSTWHFCHPKKHGQSLVGQKPQQHFFVYSTGWMHPPCTLQSTLDPVLSSTCTVRNRSGTHECKHLETEAQGTAPKSAMISSGMPHCMASSFNPMKNWLYVSLVVIHTKLLAMNKSVNRKHLVEQPWANFEGTIYSLSSQNITFLSQKKLFT